MAVFTAISSGSPFLLDNDPANGAAAQETTTVLSDGRLLVVWRDLTGGFGDLSGSAIVARNDAGTVPVVYRRQGDDNLLVEYGSMTLDIALRLRVHLLAEAVASARLPGLIDLTELFDFPTIRELARHLEGKIANS